MPYFSSYHHIKHSQQLEQMRTEVRSQVQSFQQIMLEEMRKVLKGIEREQSHTNAMYTEVLRLKEEVKQIHKQVDELVIHLLLPDLPLQKISEAIAEITNYHVILQKRKHSFDAMQQESSAAIANFASALTSRPRKPPSFKRGMNGRSLFGAWA